MLAACDERSLTIATLTFTTRYLVLRDELVLKSIVRILQGQTRHVWRYAPTFDADLLVVGHHLKTDDDCDALNLADRVMLTIKADASEQPTGNASLRVGDVLIELNRLGDIITESNGKRDLALISNGNSNPDRRFALNRWPDWKLLQGDPRYLRVATVLATRPLTMLELAQKSDCDLGTCNAFVGALDGCQLLRWEAGNEASSIDAPLPSPAKATGDTVRHVVSAVQLSEGDRAKGTLWSHIRNRLGIPNRPHAT